MSQLLNLLSSVETVPDDERGELWPLHLSTAAVSSLLDEAELTPKPALDEVVTAAEGNAPGIAVPRSAEAPTEKPAPPDALALAETLPPMSTLMRRMYPETLGCTSTV